MVRENTSLVFDLGANRFRKTGTPVVKENCEPVEVSKRRR